MNLLDSLPALPDITGRSAYPASSGTGGVMYNASVGGIPNPEAIFNEDGSRKTSRSSFGVQSIVFILLGLLFLAGGIFSFREVRQVVASGAKVAAL